MTTNSNHDLRAIEIVTPSLDELKSQFRQLPIDQQEEFLREMRRESQPVERLTVLLNGNVNQAEKVFQFNNVPPELVERFLEVLADQMRS